MAQLTYKAMKDNAALKNLPILTLDQRWYRLVPESVKTDEIRYWEKRVNELLKKQGQVNEDLIQVKKIRKGLFRGIVNHMNQNDEDPKKQKIMDESQRLIYEARDKISQLEDESDEVKQSKCVMKKSTATIKTWSGWKHGLKTRGLNLRKIYWSSRTKRI